MFKLFEDAAVLFLSAKRTIIVDYQLSRPKFIIILGASLLGYSQLGQR